LCCSAKPIKHLIIHNLDTSMPFSHHAEVDFILLDLLFIGMQLWYTVFPRNRKTFLPSFNEQDINMPLTKWNITKVDNNLLVSLYCPMSNRKPLFYWPLSLPFRLSLRWPLAVLINATAMECIRKMIAAKHIICIINDLLATVCTLQNDCVKILKYHF